jgi:hypothetical protein
MESTGIAPAAPPDPHVRISVIEIVAYCGIASGVFGTIALLAQAGEDSENTAMATSVVLAVVFLLAGAVVGAGAPDRLARLRSACWFASVIAFVSFLSLAIEPSDRGAFTLVFGLTAVYALVLWFFSPRLLQQLAFFNSALGTIAVLIAFPDLGGFFFGPPDLTGIALVFWIGGSLWFALGYLDLVRPPRTAMVVGLLAALEGLFLLAEDSPELAFLIVIAGSAVALLLGGLRADRAVTGVAVVGLLIGTVGLLAALEVEGTTPGLVTMLLGVVLLGLAVWAARETGRGSRPPFGGIRSPFGRPPAPPAPAVPPAPSEPDVTPPAPSEPDVGPPAPF